MSFSISVSQGIALVQYTGDVGYGERADAVIRSISEVSGLPSLRVLSDFSEARVYEESSASRADFIARVITAPWPQDSRVALVGLPDDAALPPKLAAAVRTLTFNDQRSAIRWLNG